MFYIWNPYLIIDFFWDKLRIKNLENSKIFLYSWDPIKISKIFEVLFNWFKTEKEILWELYKLLWKKDSFILWKYFLEKDIVDIISSDAHNLDTRKPYMKEAYDVILKKYGEEKAKLLFELNAENILRDED